MADIFYIRQKEPLGLGHAILCAKKHVGNEPFAVMLGDDIVVSDRPCIGQLREVFDKMRASVVGVEQVPKSRIQRYGVIKGKRVRDDIYKVDDLVEKPAPHEAPSDLAIIGRYILAPEIFGFLERIGPGKGGEYQLTDAHEAHVPQERTLRATVQGQKIRHREQGRLGFIFFVSVKLPAFNV